MRIAYVLDQIIPNSGADVDQAINTVSALVRKGADVTLYLPRPLGGSGATAQELRDYFKIEQHLKIVSLGLPMANFRAPLKIAHPIRVSLRRDLADYDIVYTRNLPMVAASLQSGHKVVYDTYRPWPRQYPILTPIFRTLMKHENFVGAALHSDYARTCYMDIGVPENKAQVMYNGYRPDLFEPRLTTSQARAQLDLPGDRPIAVYSGRINLSKGLGIVLDMARRNPKVVILLIGSQEQGEVEKQASSMENVRILPWMGFSEVVPYLYAADILLIPPSSIPLQKARNTVLPIKLFSYLAAGRPILAPFSPDTAELLINDDNAVLVKADDIDEASAALRSIAGDHERAERLGRRCWELAKTLTWDARAERLLAFIESRLQEMSA